MVMSRIVFCIVILGLDLQSLSHLPDSRIRASQKAIALPPITVPEQQ